MKSFEGLDRNEIYLEKLYENDFYKVYFRSVDFIDFVVL